MEWNYNNSNSSILKGGNKVSRVDKSPVDQARRLVDSLSNLDRETAESVWGSREGLSKDYGPVHDGPAPLEYYLKYPKASDNAASSPYPNFGDRRQEVDSKQRRQHRSNSGHYVEAKQILKQLEMTQATLERNLQQVARSRRDMHVFNALLSGAAEGGSNDQMKIEKLVSKKIASLNDDIQREVLRGLAEEEAKKLAAEVEQARLKVAAKKNVGRPDYTRNNAFKQMVEEAKLNQLKAAQPAQLKYFNKGKENKSMAKKQPAKPSVIKDEKTMTRTYGKAEYQRGRTTIRDPYMHFQNSKKGRPVGLNDSMVSRDGRSRSPKSKKNLKSAEESSVPRQYFFSPTRGYIPLDSAASGPIEGQIVPMAIPLGAPRMEPGVRKSATPIASKSPDPITSTPVPVTAVSRNAAVISFPAKEMREQRDREPELSKQVLPPIDIDSISPSSSRRSDIQIRSPQQGHPNVTFMCETFDEENFNLNNKSFGEEDEESDEDEQAGEGIKLPGYEPKMPEYTGPSFPPQTSAGKPDWNAGGEQIPAPTLVSNVMAEDLRRRDVLENNAITWLEQELMARVLTEVMPLKMAVENTDISMAQSVKSEESEREDSLLVADMIGQGGLQLFIDAGQAVDNALVNALVKEVLQEKVNTMLSQRDNENNDQRPLAKGAMTDEFEEALNRKDQMQPQQVPTPEMTPKTSPFSSPRRLVTHNHQPETPPISPPSASAHDFKRTRDMLEEESAALELASLKAQQQQRYVPEPQPQPVLPEPELVEETQKPLMPEIESESETSVSLDISEELRRIGGKAIEYVGTTAACHDVATPPLSPEPLIEEEKPTVTFRQSTPPSSPTMQPAVVAQPPPQRQKSEEVAEEKAPKVAQKEEEKEEEVEEEEEIDQPKPLMMSIAVGEDKPIFSDREQQTRSRSPSPQRRRSQAVQSPTSDSQLLSEESTLSESVNDNISEGQWLLSRSEGQIVGLPGKIMSHDLRRGYQQMVDLSTASTLRDTDDLDMDDSHAGKSEGEILVTGLPTPEQDPMLELLVQMQKNPLLAIQKDLSRAQIAQVLQQGDHRGIVDQRGMTGRSLGEMSMGQVAPSRLVEVRPKRVEERPRRGRGSPSFSPTNSLERSVTDDNYSFEEGRRNGRGMREANGRQQRRSPSPQWQQQPPQRQQQQQQQQQRPRNRSPDLAPNGARNKTRGQMQYQPVLSDSAPMLTKTRSPTKYNNRQRDSRESNRLSRSTDQAYRKSGSSNFRQSEPSVSNIYSSDQISRSAESLSMRRSGEGGLTSSLKSKQSNVKKSVEFDLTGTYGRTRSSMSRSRDSNLSGGSRLSDPGESLGMTYSFDHSIDESELRRIMDENGSSYGPYRMSVTLPSTGHENDSDVSEIDISQNE